MKAISIAVLLLTIFVYYFAMSFQGRLVPPPPVPNYWGRTPDNHLAPSPANNFYAMLSESLLAGKLHFLDEPRRQLLELKDVYNPDDNYPWRRYHDASLYKRHWYIYFGVTPALILGIPAKFMGYALRDDVAVPLFCWLGLLAALGLLRAIVRQGDLKPSLWMWISAVLYMALCAAQPYTMARSQVYEVAISCGFFCTMTAFYFLFTGYFGDKIIAWKLAFGSLFLALAVGSRPNAILHGWMLVALSALIYFNRANTPSKEKPIYYLALWVPYIFYGYCLGLYNYLRFDSWTNFGFGYALTSFDMRKLPMFDFRFLLPNLWFYFVQPLELNAVFPFFHTRLSYPGTLPTPYFQHQVAGILVTSPILLILPFFPVAIRSFAKSNSTSERTTVKWIIGALVLSGFLQITLLLLAFPYALFRYIVDFAPSLVLAALLTWFYFDAQLTSNGYVRWRRLMNAGVAIAILIGCTENLALGLAGEDDYFKKFNPAGYEEIRRPFEFIERLGGTKP